MTSHARTRQAAATAYYLGRPAAFWLAALGARPTAHPHVAARSSWRSVTRRAVRAARAPRDRSAEAGPCRVAALANAWSAAGQRRAVVRPAQMVLG